MGATLLFKFFSKIFALLDPNPDSELDPETSLNPDPDPKLCKKGYLTFFIKAARIREDFRDGPILVFQLVTVL